MRQFNPVCLCAAVLSIALAGSAFASGEQPDKVTGAVKATAASQPPRGKPGSGVVMEHSVPHTIPIGETVTLRLQFSGVTAGDGATVAVCDPSTRETLLTVWLSQGERRIIELPYMSRTDGMQFIDVETTQGRRTTVQSVALPVGSGELKLKPAGKKQVSANGESVISLPAAER